MYNDQGNTFYDEVVQNDFDSWDEVWVYKMALSIRGGIIKWYFDEIKKEYTDRAEFLREILNLKLGGSRSIAS